MLGERVSAHRPAPTDDRVRRRNSTGSAIASTACYRQHRICSVTRRMRRLEVALGERAFEIVLARRVAAGDETTTWFERHGSTPITEIPRTGPRTTVRSSSAGSTLIERDRNIGLIERPSTSAAGTRRVLGGRRSSAALRDWLLDRLEAPHLWPASADQPPQLTTVNRLADAVRADAELHADRRAVRRPRRLRPRAARGRAGRGESVPFLPVLRYTDTGLRKRAQWEDTWELQRREDAGEKRRQDPRAAQVQEQGLPEGRLLAPARRAGRAQGTLRQLPRLRTRRRHQPAHRLGRLEPPAAGHRPRRLLPRDEGERGLGAARLQPLLAGLLELVPWLEQWHNELDPAYGERMGTYYRGFVNEEARALGFTLDDLRAWKPVVTAAKRGRKKASA